MKNKWFLLVLGFFLSTTIKADIGSFDLVKIELEDKEYYITVFNVGKLIENGLCYLTWEEEELNMKEHLLQQFSRYDSIEIHEVARIIPFKKLGLRLMDKEDQLIVVGKSKKVSKEAFENLEVVSAITGNTFGYTYSEALVTEDISWIYEYPLEILSKIDRVGMCDYRFYGIKGNYSKEDKRALNKLVKASIKEGIIINKEVLFKELYSRHIFALGFCSC